MSDAPFFPPDVFAPADSTQPVPRVLLAPPRYIQGPGAIDGLGRYLGLLRARRAGVLASRRGQAAEGARVASSLGNAGIDAVPAVFIGECSLEAIDAAVEELAAARVDVLMAVGGGKCVDAGKCIAARLDVPVVIVPTLASNDAPCSAVSVMYTPEGAMSGAEFFPQSPSMVVVDTAVVAAASERYLAAGMGDAMATWYEARVCRHNPAARNVIGARPTLAACVMGETCAHTLFESGVSASAAVRAGAVDDALERVVEANTLLSGVGFESGGVAAAHALAQGYTSIPAVEHNYLHGEMVAMGVLTQLVMEGAAEDAQRAGRFFIDVGLPVCLEQIGLAPTSPELTALVEGAMAFDFIHNMPMTVTPERVREAVLGADAVGRDLSDALGDEAYRRVQGS